MSRLAGAQGGLKMPFIQVGNVRRLELKVSLGYASNKEGSAHFSRDLQACLVLSVLLHTSDSAGVDHPELDRTTRRTGVDEQHSAFAFWCSSQVHWTSLLDLGHLSILLWPFFRFLGFFRSTSRLALWLSGRRHRWSHQSSSTLRSLESISRRWLSRFERGNICRWWSGEGVEGIAGRFGR